MEVTSYEYSEHRSGGSGKVVIQFPFRCIADKGYNTHRSRTMSAIAYKGLRLLLEVSVQLGIDENDTVEELLDHRVLVLGILV